MATITSGGLATGVATGSTTIQATSGAISGSTGLTVMPSELVGWWTFDDGTGTTAADSSGNGLTPAGERGELGAGQDRGCDFGQRGESIRHMPAINLSGTGAVTVATWVNRTYTAGDTRCWNSPNYNGSTTGFGLFPDAHLRRDEASLHGDVGYSVNCYAQPSSGVWHHLAVVYDKTQAGSKR